MQINLSHDVIVSEAGDKKNWLHGFTEYQSSFYLQQIVDLGLFNTYS